MKKFIFLVLALLLMSVTSAVAQDVRYNFAKDVDFSKFKTYKWVDIKGADHANQLVQKQITDTIEAELAKKGLTKTDSDSADLYIGYQTAVGTEKQFTSYNTGWGYGPGWGGGWYGGMGSTMTTGSTSTIYVGQLGLDHVRFRKKGPGMARRSEQEHRPQGATGKTERTLRKRWKNFRRTTQRRRNRDLRGLARRCSRLKSRGGTKGAKRKRACRLFVAGKVHSMR